MSGDSVQNGCLRCLIPASPSGRPDDSTVRNWTPNRGRLGRQRRPRTGRVGETLEIPMAQSIPDFFMKRFLPWMEREKVRASSGLSLFIHFPDPLDQTKIRLSRKMDLSRSDLPGAAALPDGFREMIRHLSLQYVGKDRTGVVPKTHRSASELSSSLLAPKQAPNSPDNRRSRLLSSSSSRSGSASPLLDAPAPA